MSAGTSMIEHASEFGASAAIPLTPGDTTHLSAGSMLRQAREAQGLHIEAVAAVLKVPPQKLEALEADDIDALPDPVFARALAAGVCRALRIDPAPVLAKLPGALRDGLAQADRTMSGNIRSHADRRQARGNWTLSKPLLVTVGLLLAGAALLYWMPQSAFDRIGAVFTGWTSRDASSAAAPSGGEPPAAPAAAPGTVVEPVAVGAPPPTAPLAAAATAAPVVSRELVSFSARAEAWVTVTEPGGKVLLKRTLKQGETVALSGTLPLSVVVGRAAGVDVQVRGQAFDLAPITKSGGIARFEVK